MTLIITQAGLARAVQADISGISLKIAEVGIGINGYAPNNTMTALQNEIARMPVSGGKQITPNQIHITSLFDGDTEIVGREVGFYLEDGTLFALDSHPSIIIAYKSGATGSRSIEAFDLILDSVPPGSITVDVTGDLSINFDQEFQEIDDQFALLWAAQYPVGAPIPWPTDTAPIGFAIMKGQAFDTEANPELVAAYPTGIFEDMRGLAIVGKDDNEVVLAYEADGVKSHAHNGTVYSTDLGTKSTTSDTHYHGVSDVPHNGSPYGDSVDITSSSQSGGYDTRNTDSDTHYHSVSIGSHAHALLINAFGATENTIKNRKFNWIVRMA